MAMENTDFRRVILTNKLSQVVLMSVEPGDDIGEETHEVDQILYFVDGEGEAVLSGKKSKVAAGQPGVGAGRHAAQLHQHRRPAAEALHHLRAARGGARHRPQDKAEAEAAEAEKDED